VSKVARIVERVGMSGTVVIPTQVGIQKMDPRLRGDDIVRDAGMKL
jgi:hypothetical protein